MFTTCNGLVKTTNSFIVYANCLAVRKLLVPLKKPIVKCMFVNIWTLINANTSMCFSQ